MLICLPFILKGNIHELVISKDGGMLSLEGSVDHNQT